LEEIVRKCVYVKIMLDVIKSPVVVRVRLDILVRLVNFVRIIIKNVLENKSNMLNRMSTIYIWILLFSNM